MIRVAEWLTWTTYTLLVAAGAAALFAGALLGTVALARDPGARRLAPVATVAAGWTGTLALTWLSLEFWGH